METNMIVFKSTPKEMIYTEIPKEYESIIAEGKYRDFPFFIVNMFNKFPCTFIQCDDKNSKDPSDYPFNVHGEISFLGYDKTKSGFSILPDADMNKIWIGWHYAHMTDFNPNCIFIGKKWTTDELIQDMKRTIDEFYENLATKEETETDFDIDIYEDDNVEIKIIFKDGSEKAAKRRQLEENHKKKILSSLHKYYNGYYLASECDLIKTTLKDTNNIKYGIRRVRTKLSKSDKEYKRASKKIVRRKLNSNLEEDLSQLGKGITTKMYAKCFKID